MFCVAGDGSGELELTVLIGAAAGGVLFIVVLIIAFCCLCRYLPLGSNFENVSFSGSDSATLPNYNLRAQLYPYQTLHGFIIAELVHTKSRFGSSTQL